MPKYFIKTFGCQMNFSDSERLAHFLEKSKFKLAPAIDEADLVIFNSCGVRKMAEDRALGQIHNLKKNNSKIKIALTGCISHRKDIKKILEKKVDLFFEIKDFNLLKNFIDKNFSKNIKNTAEKIAYLSIKPKYANKFSACIPIMTGCNNFCSYCVVPYARGREISRPVEEIITEIKSLTSKGYKEIILLGQNVNSYRGKLKNSKEINFSRLLKMIDRIPGNFWIRFMSPHPKDMSDELIETITRAKKVCEIIHLPLQSGSDEILKNMNRRYTRKHYMELIKKIKSEFKKNKPDKLFAISSDIIVGFPGETRKQLEASAEIMRQVKYDMVYFGQFSRRPETAAWQMKDNVSKKEKERREKYLNEILAETALLNNKKYLNKTFEILVDNQKGENYFGKTRTLKNVMFKSDKKNLIGNFVKVKITKATSWHLEGEIL